MLTRRDRFPHVTVRCIDGTTFEYGDLWQRRHLLLVTLAGEGADRAEDEARYIARLNDRHDELQRYETTVVITRDAIAGVPAPAVLIADRWGEIVTVESAPQVASLPEVSDLLDWLRMIAHACSW